MLYYNSKQLSSSYEFGNQLLEKICRQRAANQPLVFLCIGSDRATGESLGPLIGYKLEQHPSRNYLVYGTLEAPVHAKNLATVVEKIHSRHKNPYIIAIDASLGNQDHVQNGKLHRFPLR